MEGAKQDMFNEIGNIGAGHAATALSTMINKKVNISLPTAELISRNDIVPNDNTAEIMVVNCKLQGDLVGNLLVVYNKETAFPLIDMVSGQEKGTLKELDEMSKSAFKEVVNIIAGPYLDSLSEMTQFTLLPQPPTFSFGKVINIKDQILREMPDNAEQIISVKTKLSIEQEVIFGDIFLILDPESLTKLLGKLED